MESYTSGNGNGLSDLYILPENTEEFEKITNYLCENDVRHSLEVSNVKGQGWYGKAFISIPFGEGMLGVIKQAVEYKTFDAALTDFIAGCQEQIDNANLCFQTRLVVRNANAKKYIAIDRQEMRDGVWVNSSVHCFVAAKEGYTKQMGMVEVGDVLKAASYKTPARGARGNIFDENGGLGRMGWTGPGYNR